MKATYTAIKEEGKVRVRYFVSGVSAEEYSLFSSWISLGWGKFAKDAYSKVDAIEIINYLKSLGIEC